MIPRTARRLERTLLSARQALPRPARLYSTPSKKLNAPATATVISPSPENFPAFLDTSSSAADRRPQIDQFLGRDIPLTILPTPEPFKETTLHSQRWYADSQALDMTGIIDACLHNLYDVPRAHEVFSRLRTKVGTAALETPIYNAFLESYIGMAKKEEAKKSYWIEEAWKLYSAMESGAEDIHPNAKTYSIVLLLWQEFEASNAAEGTSSMLSCDPGYLLSKIVERKIPIMDVVCNPFQTDPNVITAIANTVAVQALNLGFKQVLVDLGHAKVGFEAEDVFRDVPEVMPVVKEVITKDVDDIKKIDLEVPFSLDGLRRHLARVTEARSYLHGDINARQKHLESSVYDLAIERLQHQDEVFAQKGIDNGSLKDSKLRRWMWDWHVRLRDQLKIELEKIQESDGKKKPHERLFPYLSLVKHEQLSLLTILEIMRLQGSGGVMGGMKTTRALVAVGKAVENEHKAQICKKNGIPPPQFGSRDDLFTIRGYQNLRQRRVAAAQMASDGEEWSSPWTQPLRAKVGSVLVNLLIQVAEVVREAVDPHTHAILTEPQPAFYQSYEYVRGQKLGVIKIHSLVTDRLAKDSLERTIHPRHLPMLVKPKPWINYNNGGYLYNKSHAMRFKDSQEQEVYLREATNAGNVELVYAGLDVLGATPWVVNKAIFDIVVTVWNSGERMGKMPPAVFDQPEPAIPEGADKDLQARSHHIVRQRAWAGAKANNHSDRCSVNYKIEIARAFLHDTFFLPHNLDFRGRAYPIPPHLNHMGDDLSRGMLLFEESKPLGVRGFRWLKIHAANLYGYDKANFDDRVEWVEEHLDKVLESANNPLDGSRWWLKADDPWQFLATCIEIRNAVQLDDPTQYSSALPIHQDGTCNGLQHYAALGGDAQGAQQVNLAAADKPSDVYTHISSKVQQIVSEEAEAGVELAQLLNGKISRKVVKQTVMTTVYGVTFIGARDQIEKQLRDRGDIPEEKCWHAAAYLARKLLATIGDTFKGAKDIQNWLNLCARLIAKSIPQNRLGLRRDESGQEVVTLPRMKIKKEQMTSVIWTTALGLPIVQPYRKTARKQVMTAIQSVYISDPHTAAEVNAVKQASAFPPNFIHSLDATHMLLTALECKNRGLTFASIHDSYWTHACDIDTMSEVIRETFIALHQSDILERLDLEFRDRYKDFHIPLVDINSTTKNRGSLLVTKLKTAGTRVFAHPSQADDLRVIEPLVEYTNDGEKMAVITAQQSPADVELAMDETEVEVDSVAEEIELEEDLVMEMEEAEAEMEEGGKKKRGRKPKKVKPAVKKFEGKLLSSKFIKLTDLMPPLPKKGSFRVESIKASPYFFS
ncbi:hypothetical protein GALMADRAFT_212223 [Galerina marginata CBS 339.88]|uniref:DNA-directed RNA polymerase n=1 Tax=Galerina marginata (strain CBS 339.88) TaxID=685588 RepID=A0A067SSY6_GALM3|nr:hypothetical protein GALMADRAFT_212223 [Galerina marginata CBS 339.88]